MLLCVYFGAVINNKTNEKSEASNCNSSIYVEDSNATSRAKRPMTKVKKSLQSYFFHFAPTV